LEESLLGLLTTLFATVQLNKKIKIQFFIMIEFFLSYTGSNSSPSSVQNLDASNEQFWDEKSKSVDKTWNWTKCTVPEN
jgi:hypothetical protein